MLVGETIARSLRAVVQREEALREAQERFRRYDKAKSALAGLPGQVLRPQAVGA